MSNDIPTRAREIVRTRDFGRCFRCGGRGSAWHHRRSRGVLGPLTHSPCNGIWLCTTCHIWVHSNPFASRAMGWIVSRSIEDPATVPVKAHFGWVRLNHEGSFKYVTQDEMDQTAQPFTAL